MSNDLNNLRISQEDLKELTGLTIENFFDDSKLLSAKVVRPSLAKNTKAQEELYKEEYAMKAGGIGCLFSLLPCLVMFTVHSGPGLVLFLWLCAIPFAGYGLGYCWSIWSIKTNTIRYQEWSSSLQQTPLGSLLDEVQKYNKNAKNIGVIDKLKELGHPVEVEKRDEVIKGFKKIKSELIRALKTERILRENPGFKPEEFSIDFTFLKGVIFEEKAKTYAQYINEAIDIGLRVEEEMKNLTKLVELESPE